MLVGSEAAVMGNQFRDENPYQSSDAPIRAELVVPPPQKQPWPLWAKLVVITVAIMFGPGAIGVLMIFVLWILMALGCVPDPSTTG
jgi:hypothetical protein